jgi:pyruvate-formate lyase
MLYNDDVVVPGVARAMHLSVEAAQDYYPLGCGEYMIGWSSPSLLCCGWNVGKSLDAALHDGYSGGQAVGPRTGSPESFDTYEKLYAAYMAQIAFCAEMSARAYSNVLDSVPQECPFLLASLLTDDCLEVGKGILEGSRHIGGCVMGHGFTNAADALVAIRQLVYREKRLSLKQLVAALDADFEGHEELRKALAAAPKFGNDHDEVDQTLVEMWRQINDAADQAGLRHRLGFHTVSSVNPGGYAMGEECPATADGRKKGQPFAIGHAPAAGRDTSGLTALFNSIAKADAANGGAATNVKISRELFTRSRDKLEAMFGSYFDRGGQEATVTVVNRHDLESAMKEPAKYAHVLVRLGGWCARFIDLDRTIQEEIIRRTLY